MEQMDRERRRGIHTFDVDDGVTVSMLGSRGPGQAYEMWLLSSFS